MTSVVAAALAASLPAKLVDDLVGEFVALKRDAATGTLGRSAPGKFVETTVQCLQHLETGSHEVKPNVDDYLKNLESRTTTLDDGLRICAARVARSMYTLRNKRNIAHKGSVDPNVYDLRFLFHGAQWVLAEFVRVSGKISMANAGDAVAEIQAPLDAIVETIGAEQLVLADVSTPEEILILMHSSYPEAVESAKVFASLQRRNPDTVRKAIRGLWEAKLIAGPVKGPYRLSQTGYKKAADLVAQLVSA
jgi:hypothetical protein